MHCDRWCYVTNDAMWQMKCHKCDVTNWLVTNPIWQMQCDICKCNVTNAIGKIQCDKCNMTNEIQ